MGGSIAKMRRRYEALSAVLYERGRRRFATAEAHSYGFGGVSAVASVTGMARSTAAHGLDELEQKPEVETGRVRKPGGGRKSKCVADSTLLADQKRLVEPATRGDPMRTLRWTSKSLRHLSKALQAQKHSVCPNVIADWLREPGYSLQANRKTREVRGHMNGNAQFQYLNDQATAFLRADEPVISVATKKKELVGNFKNNGLEWRPQATPEAVKAHDFIDPKLGAQFLTEFMTSPITRTG